MKLYFHYPILPSVVLNWALDTSSCGTCLSTGILIIHLAYTLFVKSGQWLLLLSSNTTWITSVNDIASLKQVWTNSGKELFPTTVVCSQISCEISAAEVYENKFEKRAVYRISLSSDRRSKTWSWNTENTRSLRKYVMLQSLSTQSYLSSLSEPTELHQERNGSPNWIFVTLHRNMKLY
jgi:hypothetical protein